MEWHNWLLLLSVALLLGVAIGLRPLLNWRRTGINPVRIPPPEGIAGLATQAFKVVLIAVPVTVLVFVFAPQRAIWLGAIPWLQVPALQIAGILLILLASALIFLAQAHMGDSFRIGIDTENATPLVQGGLYRYSRNPIFLGMRIALLGYFLAMPNAASLACWLVGDLTIQMQVLLEEEFLRQQHGAAYERFLRSVRRWL